SSSSTSRVMAMANTPSLNASRRSLGTSPTVRHRHQVVSPIDRRRRQRSRAMCRTVRRTTTGEGTMGWERRGAVIGTVAIWCAVAGGVGWCGGTGLAGTAPTGASSGGTAAGSSSDDAALDELVDAYVAGAVGGAVVLAIRDGQLTTAAAGDADSDGDP